MLEKYESKIANEKIKEQLKRYADSYSRIKEQAKSDYIKSLGPGAIVPKEVALSGTYAEQFENIIIDVQNKVNDIIEPFMKKLEEKFVEAPSTDEVNMISLLKVRNNLTKDEVFQIADKYGEKPQVYRAIQDIAHDHDIYLIDHPINQQIEDIKSVLKSVNGFSVYDAERDHATSGYMSFIGMSVDNAFPIEE